MPNHPRPWTERILSLVDAGVTERAEIVRRTIPFVPQGHAFRVREINNEKLRRSHAVDGVVPPPRTRVRSLSEIHRIGAGHVVRHAIHALLQSGTLVRDGPDHLRRPEVKMRPHNGKKPTT